MARAAMPFVVAPTRYGKVPPAERQRGLPIPGEERDGHLRSRGDISRKRPLVERPRLCHALEPIRRRLGVALLSLEVDIEEPLALVVSVRPAEHIHE